MQLVVRLLVLLGVFVVAQQLTPEEWFEPPEDGWVAPQFGPRLKSTVRFDHSDCLGAIIDAHYVLAAEDCVKDHGSPNINMVSFICTFISDVHSKYIRMFSDYFSVLSRCIGPIS